MNKTRKICQFVAVSLISVFSTVSMAQTPKESSSQDTFTGKGLAQFDFFYAGKAKK